MLSTTPGQRGQEHYREVKGRVTRGGMTMKITQNGEMLFIEVEPEGHDANADGEVTEP
jgi:hypothetical protein